MEAIEPAAKLEPAVKEFATPTSLTTVTVIQDLELDDSYQSSTSNKRKADDDAAEEEDDGQESKTIPSKVRENTWNADNGPMQKVMSDIFSRAKRNSLRKMQQRLQSKYDSTYYTISLLKADHRISSGKSSDTRLKRYEARTKVKQRTQSPGERMISRREEMLREEVIQRGEAKEREGERDDSVSLHNAISCKLRCYYYSSPLC